MLNKPRIALIVSHPIQHFCPQYKSWAKILGDDFKVFFGSKLGVKPYYDENFKKDISWSNLFLDEFNHEFLNGDAIIASDKSLDSSKLEERLIDFLPNIIIVYGYFQKIQQRAYNFALANKIKIAYISDSEMMHKGSWKTNLIKQFYLRKYFRKIDIFLTVGNSNESYYQFYGVPKSKLLRMHFPIDIDLYQQAYEDRIKLRTLKRASLGISNDTILLSVVGKLVSWKSQDHLISTLALLNKSKSNFHLIIIGSGQMLEKWQLLANEQHLANISFAGFVDPQDLPSYYAATDIYVHPASLEPHSLAISEAIYMGCPILISDTCGSYGETDDVRESNGIVFPFGNIEVLAKSIIEISTDKNKMNSFSDNSHKFAIQHQKRSHQDLISNLQNKFFFE